MPECGDGVLCMRGHELVGVRRHSVVSTACPVESSGEVVGAWAFWRPAKHSSGLTTLGTNTGIQCPDCNTSFECGRSMEDSRPLQFQSCV